MSGLVCRWAGKGDKGGPKVGWDGDVGGADTSHKYVDMLVEEGTFQRLGEVVVKVAGGLDGLEDE